jgi:ATP-binding cassette subfamily F protein 3
MHSKDVLKEAIRAFDGTAIIVSHDREFLDGLATKVYEFGGKRVREHLGGIWEYLEKKDVEGVKELKGGRGVKEAEGVRGVKEKRDERKESPVQDYQARKEQQRQQKRLEREIAVLEKQIEALEGEMKKTETVLATPEGASNVDLLWKHADLQQQLDSLMEKWTEASASILQ